MYICLSAYAHTSKKPKSEKNGLLHNIVNILKIATTKR